MSWSTSIPPYHSTSTVMTMGRNVYRKVYPTTYLASMEFCLQNSPSFAEKSAEEKGSPAKALMVLRPPRDSSATSVASARAFCVLFDIFLK